ncbi:MAG: phosphopantetheine-binding protein [Chthoniobacteraceae bacterium]
MPSAESREQEITRTLKRCSKATIEAALRYQSTQADEDLILIIRGVLTRALPDENAAAVETANDDSRLVEDLGLDSFGMIEVVMAAETIFGIFIANSEMKGNVTLGELRAFLKSKLGESPSTEALPS